MTRRRAGLVSVGLFIGATFLMAAAPTTAHDTGGSARVLLKDLQSPKGIALDSSKSVVIGQGAYGPPGPAFQYVFKGSTRGQVTNLTDPVNIADVAVTRDGAGWAIGGDLVLYRQAVGGAIEPILDIAAYQAADIDPYNDPTQDPAESNPFGLAAYKNDVLIADAAGNDVIRVKADGTAWTVARWTRRLVRTDKVGDPALPPRLLAEAVPTSIAIKDGWAYVGQLVGFPGRPGSAYIWRVNPNARDTVCDAKHQRRACKVWKTGFTSIMDLAFNPKNGTLYVYQIARKGWLAFEAGFAPGGTFPPAVLLEVRGKSRRELVKGKLSQPGGIVVARDGTILVTDGMFTGGRLLRIRR
jgi:hypothetical protein